MYFLYFVNIWYAWFTLYGLVKISRKKTFAYIPEKCMIKFDLFNKSLRVLNFTKYECFPDINICRPGRFE